MIVRTAALFRPLHAALIELLRGLDAGDWDRRAGAGEWSVRDTTAHLLDGDLRRISADRDGHVPVPDVPISGYGDLVRWLNGLNAEWVAAARRMSTRLLVDLLEETGATTASLMEVNESREDATFPVAWAGQTRSPMWLDIGREYTERWHHQDQIREAVGATPLVEPRLLRPVIAVSLFALPPALSAVTRPDGTCIDITASGPGGGSWSIARSGGEWRITEGRTAQCTARIGTSDIALARLLLHRLTAADVAGLIEAEGDRALIDAVVGARAVMV